MAAETTLNLEPTPDMATASLPLSTGPRVSPGRCDVVDNPATPIAILGVPFDNITFAQTVSLIEKMIHSRQPHYLATANVDFLVQASEDVELRRILFDANLVICDGTPLVWASRFLGNPLPERVAGSDLVPLLIKLAAEKGYRPFFLGATPDVAETAVQKIKAQYPAIDIAGYYSPPFNRLLEMDHEEIRRRIEATKPDILFVGFGCPKQEKWISMHYRSLGVPVSVGIGATIDFLAGKVARAPVWMQRTGTEWMFRLAQEPKRLLGRYSKDLRHFSGAIFSQWWSLKARRPLKTRPALPPTSPKEGSYAVIRGPERMDIESVHHQRDNWEQLVSSQPLCFFDLRNVTFIDSTGVGMLIRLQKRARNNSRQLVLVAPSESVQRALQLMQLQEFFMIAPDARSAEMLVEIQRTARSVALRNVAQSATPALCWQGELTAVNADEVWETTKAHVANAKGGEVVLDLANLRFIDSSGLSVMIKCRKLATQQQRALRFIHVQPGVRNVIQLARLEEFLLSTSHENRNHHLS